jgi:AraC-like DNA-binding protein
MRVLLRRQLATAAVPFVPLNAAAGNRTQVRHANGTRLITPRNVGCLAWNITVQWEGCTVAELSVSGPDDWAALCSSTFVPLRVRTVDPAFHAGLRHVALTDSAGVTSVHSAGSEVFRSERMIRSNPGDGFLFAVHGDGTGTVAQNGRLVTMTRGQATIYDTETPYSLGFPSAMSETVLHVPRRVLDPRGIRSPDITARLINADNPALSALAALMFSVVDGPERSVEEGRLIAEAAISLAQTAVALSGTGEAPAPDASRLALRVQVHSFVDTNLADPRLTPETLAAAHHVSLRQLQVVLADVGETPSEVIRTKRLSRARTLLTTGVGISAAAHRSGFSDVGTFTRAFGRRYEQSPSAFRRTVRELPGAVRPTPPDSMPLL